MNLTKKWPEYWIVESTNHCNLACPICDNKYMRRTKGFMPFEDFKNYLIQLKEIGAKKIDFDLGGEPLLNKDLFKMVALAHGLGIKTSFSTNGTLLDKKCYALFDSCLDNLLISLDGMSAESYEKVRIGAKFKKVKANIESLMEYKEKHGYNRPKILLSFIVTKYNEDEISEFKDWARKNSNGFIVKSLSVNTKYEDEAKEFQSVNPNFKRISQKKNCDWKTKNGVILWNGNLGLCCVDILGRHTFGNLKEKPLKDLLQTAEYHARNELISGKVFGLCKNCRELKVII